jgi:hypothetical protein
MIRAERPMRTTLHRPGIAAGNHEIRVRCGDSRIATQSLHLAEGERRELELAPRPRAGAK